MAFPVVSSVVIAKRMERYGVTGIIAEGGESGGHVGEATTMSLLPQMVEAVSIPIIAAGGIASGKQLDACLMMGASGIQIGTILLASLECPIHENYSMHYLRQRERMRLLQEELVVHRFVYLRIR
jgi:enoyl-[acyl-carrier protein] reductase II